MTGREHSSILAFGERPHGAQRGRRAAVEQHRTKQGVGMIEIRKIITMREAIVSELGVAASRPTIRAVGMAVIGNPFAGKFVEDLKALFEAGAMLGERLMPDLVKLLDGPAVSYGKGAIVGVAGEMEHGGACVHPMLGKPMRAAIGGGKAVIGSNVKVAAAGASLDIPLGHKDESWSFPHFDTITVSVADAPRPDEIVVVIAIADGGRLRNRCGTEPIR
jgi:Amino acid synthesis